MNSKILQCVIVVIYLCANLYGYGQGKVTRPTNQQSRTSNHKTSRNVTISEPDGYINGHKVTGPNGKSLFLPCGGCKQNYKEPYLGEGNYLTSDHDGYGPKWFNIYGDHSRQGYGDIDYYAGRSVRAVVR